MTKVDGTKDMPKTTKAKQFLAWLLLAVAPLALGGNEKKANSTDVPPKPIYTPDPEYTPSARHDQVQGIVVVRINLDADGIPHDVKVARGLRSDLDQKAIEAVTKWRFTPAMKDGKPVSASVNVEVAFRLY